jgi:2-polyprenyl-3-methyl-5-hydroxy-6-metoxy-1,4-benzoquinol methylase
MEQQPEIRDVLAEMEAEQPTRSGKKRPERRFDKTQLKSNHHGNYVHRDYAAHFFRWGWVSRHIDKGDRILEVGCGQELPLMRVLSGNMSTIPEVYVGVDLNKVEQPSSPKWAHVVSEYNFVDDYDKLIGHLGAHRDLHLQSSFNVGVCFEVIEHMMPVDGFKMLQGFRRLIQPEGRLFLSTPVFDGKAAVNHVHEYTIPELEALIRESGWNVERRFGTFMNAQEVKKVAGPEHRKTWDDLADYYGGDVLATFLAPLYPDNARNNLWVLNRVS